MFSKIPHKFSAPFGLLGDEAKLAFPTQPGGILKLATVRVRILASQDQHILSHFRPRTEYFCVRQLLGAGTWRLNITLAIFCTDLIQYFTLFDSASDVFSLIAPHHGMLLYLLCNVLAPYICVAVRRALLDAPENVATLIQVTTFRLFNLVSDHTFPSAPTSSMTALASSFIKSGSSVERSTTKEVLNCVRVLQRVLPVIFDVEGESNTFEVELLWKKEEVDGDEDTAQNIEGLDTTHFVIEDEDDSDHESQSLPPTPGPKQTKQKRRLPSLGERLLGCIFDLLFCCGFTLPTKLQVDHHKINYVIW